MVWVKGTRQEQRVCPPRLPYLQFISVFRYSAMTKHLSSVCLEKGFISLMENGRRGLGPEETEGTRTLWMAVTRWPAQLFAQCWMAPGLGGLGAWGPWGGQTAQSGERKTSSSALVQRMSGGRQTVHRAEVSPESLRSAPQNLSRAREKEKTSAESLFSLASSRNHENLKVSEKTLSGLKS